MFEYSDHHVLQEKDTGNIVCSVDNAYQNVHKNRYDNLCQSYSLLYYFGRSIHPDQKQRQMDMIQMYRKLLRNTRFQNTVLNDIIQNTQNRNLWQDLATGLPIKMDKNLFVKIGKVLDQWAQYGYWHFIQNGRCPPHNRSISPRKTARKTVQHRSMRSDKRSMRSRQKTRYNT